MILYKDYLTQTIDVIRVLIKEKDADYPHAMLIFISGF